MPTRGARLRFAFLLRLIALVHEVRHSARLFIPCCYPTISPFDPLTSLTPDGRHFSPHTDRTVCTCITTPPTNAVRKLHLSHSIQFIHVHSFRLAQTAVLAYLLTLIIHRRSV